MAEVGCAGILVADTFCGPMKKLPAGGELLALDAMPSKVGGCAANVAIDLARQGIGVDVAGCVGADAAAAIVREGLRAEGVGCERIVAVPGRPTSKTVILLVEGEDRRYIHVFGANAAFTAEHLDRTWMAGLKVFYLGGAFVMPALRAEALADALSWCRSRGVLTVVDVVLPAGADVRRDCARLLPLVDCFLPNDDEAARITGRTDPAEQARALNGMGCRLAMVTCGERGVVAARDGTLWRMGAYRMDAVDPSGAGDAFAAGVVTGLARGWDVPDLLRYAGALGASATRAVGTTDGVFRAAEAQAFVAAHPLEVRTLASP